MMFRIQLAAVLFLTVTAQAQIQVELKFKRLQYMFFIAPRREVGLIPMWD